MGSQPSCAAAFEASPQSSSTSVGRKYARIHADVALPVEADEAEGDLAQLADGVHLAGGDDVVVRLRLLEHPPHRLDVLRRVAPVALGVEVAQVEVLLLALEDRRDARG